MSRTLMEIAVYKGDEILAVGTVKEVAAKLNMKESSIRYLMMPAYQRRLAKVKRKISKAKIVERV